MLPASGAKRALSPSLDGGEGIGNPPGKRCGLYGTLSTGSRTSTDVANEDLFFGFGSMREPAEELPVCKRPSSPARAPRLEHKVADGGSELLPKRRRGRPALVISGEPVVTQAGGAVSSTAASVAAKCSTAAGQMGGKLHATPNAQQPQQCAEDIREILSPDKPLELRSVLRNRGTTTIGVGASRKACSRSAPSGIRFAEELSSSVIIENFSGEADALWYEGHVVECDRCERPLVWGAEGALHGAPGRSRFSQCQVLCNDCKTDRLFTEVGAWLAIGLAADCASQPRSQGEASHSHHGGSVARGPIAALFDALREVGPGVGANALDRLLGQHSADPNVRTDVVEKAHSRVAHLFCSSVDNAEPGGNSLKEEHDEIEGMADDQSCKEEQEDQCAQIGEQVLEQFAQVKMEEGSVASHRGAHLQGLAAGGG